MADGAQQWTRAAERLVDLVQRLLEDRADILRQLDDTDLHDRIGARFDQLAGLCTALDRELWRVGEPNKTVARWFVKGVAAATVVVVGHVGMRVSDDVYDQLTHVTDQANHVVECIDLPTAVTGAGRGEFEFSATAHAPAVESPPSSTAGYAAQHGRLDDDDEADPEPRPDERRRPLPTGRSFRTGFSDPFYEGGRQGKSSGEPPDADHEDGDPADHPFNAPVPPPEDGGAT